MTLSCLLVDDENPDRELLENLIHTYCKNLKVIAHANNVKLAEQLINKHNPAIVFLDINMPVQNGFELLKAIPEKNFLTIITTGHNQYGIQAVKAGAFDYLLKPIDVDELIEAENKILKQFQKSSELEKRHFSIYHQGEQLIIRSNDIVYLEAQGSYTTIHLANQKEILTSKNIQQIIDDIGSKELFRIHKSFAIHTSQIKSFTSLGNEGELTLKNETKLKVGRKYKQSLKDFIL